MADDRDDLEQVDAAESTGGHDEHSHSEDHKPAPAGGLGARFKRAWHWCLTHKKLSLPAVGLVVLGVLAAVPQTRYGLAGLVLKQTFPVVVVDSETSKPVSSASVDLDGRTVLTDSRGRANLHVSVGHAELAVSKKYYKSTSREVVVPFGAPKEALRIELKATGRPVPVVVVNSISQQPVANVVIKAEGTEAKTDKEGKATIVVPTTQKSLKAKLSGQGFNDADVSLVVTAEEVVANKFSVTPAGKLYMLSNASGKIDLIKTNLDGSDRQVVLAGTGKEDQYNTILLASRDWKYIALLSKRDGGDHAKLFLIETDSDKLTTMDEGEADFTIVGWSGDRFVYIVDRTKVNSWEPKKQALKSYRASTKTLTILDETTAKGSDSSYENENYGEALVLGQEVVFIKNEFSYSKVAELASSFNSVNADGSQKKQLKTFDISYVTAGTAEFGEIYLSYWSGTDSQYLEYAGGKLTDIDQGKFNASYPIYVVSPSGDKTFWSEYRDGQWVFFVGDGKGENGKQIGSSEDYAPYGWFTDDYLLVTKKSSEMRILPVAGLASDLEKSLKVSNYYKPNYYLRGYGYGYGG